MKICFLHIKGFRNFKDAKFNFNNHTAIMGFNDIGKTNLIYALRLLLDKNVSDADMELDNSDFFAYDDIKKIEIVIKFNDIEEDFVKSALKENITDKGEVYLKYEIERNSSNYKLFIGASIDKFEEIPNRYYLKAFNLKYVSSTRNLSSFIKKEKKYLLDNARRVRTEEQVKDDIKIVENVEKALETLNTDMKTISYVKDATIQMNEELNKLSYKSKSQNLTFDVAGDDINSLLEKVDLSVSANGKFLSIGGDGKLNQIFLALWTNKHNVDLNDLKEVCFYCIEEPESHLHPHQQRKLSEYLSTTLNNQVILTTHSPQIISEFSPSSIIKLYDKNKATYGANDGCSEEIEDGLFMFAHRLDIISTEAFYADLVFLVEGQSEVLFYKALAKEINIDLDRLNVSILMVDGVGFKSYINVLNLLEIPFIMRTDNDIFKVPRKEEFRYAGIQRGIDICNTYYDFTLTEEDIKEQKEDLEKISHCIDKDDVEVIESSIRLIEFLENFGIFIADKDLENDLVNSPIITKLVEFYGLDDAGEILNEMQNRKGGSMYKFLWKHKDCLSELGNDNISKPLFECKELIENLGKE